MGNNACSGRSIAMLVLSLLMLLSSLGGNYASLASLLIAAGAIWSVAAGEQGNFASAAKGAMMTWITSIIVLILIVIYFGVAMAMLNGSPDIPDFPGKKAFLPVSMSSASASSSVDVKGTARSILISVFVLDIVVLSILIWLGTSSQSCFRGLVRI